MGIRSYYDAGLGENESTLPLLNLVALSVFMYMTGMGGNCGLNAGINATAKSFPERLVDFFKINLTLTVIAYPTFHYSVPQQ